MKKIKKSSKIYSAKERKSYRKGFLRGLFTTNKQRKSNIKVFIPKNATTAQRHNILMRDDKDYVIAHRAAVRASSNIEDSRKREKIIKQFRDKYYAEVKHRTQYGIYLMSKFSD